MRAQYDRKKIAGIHSSINSRRTSHPNWWQPLSKIVIGPVAPWPLGPKRIHFRLPRNHYLAPQFESTQPSSFFNGILPSKLHRKHRNRIIRVVGGRDTPYTQFSNNGQATFMGDVVVKHLRGCKNRVMFRPLVPREKSIRPVFIVRLPKQAGKSI